MPAFIIENRAFEGKTNHISHKRPFEKFSAAEVVLEYKKRLLQMCCKSLVLCLQRHCKLFSNDGMLSIVDRYERIIWVCGKLYHGQICNVYKVLSIVVFII